MTNQQLVARIKKSSKYAYQAPDGEWFEVEVRPDGSSYSLDGNNNRYRFSDVTFGIMLENGDVVPLPTRRAGDIALAPGSPRGVRKFSPQHTEFL